MSDSLSNPLRINSSFNRHSGQETRNLFDCKSRETWKQGLKNDHKFFCRKCNSDVRFAMASPSRSDERLYLHHRYKGIGVSKREPGELLPIVSFEKSILVRPGRASGAVQRSSHEFSHSPDLRAKRQKGQPGRICLRSKDRDAERRPSRQRRQYLLSAQKFAVSGRTTPNASRIGWTKNGSKRFGTRRMAASKLS
jgi:hypothetical protein